MPPCTYVHRHEVGSHYDVLKNVVYIQTIKLMQEAHPDGVVLIDTHSGPGVYDEVPEAYHKAANKVIERNLNAPPPVKKYVSILNKLKKEFGDGTLPGSPLFAREMMRENDEHRLVDLFEEDVEGLFEDAVFQQADAYAPETLDILLPNNEPLHPIVLIDPPYDDDQDWFKARALFESILDRRPDATIVMWIPFIRDHGQRWSYAKSLKELAKSKAKVGRYYCTIVVRKDQLEGGAMMVANATKDLIDVVDEETLEWLAGVMNQGKGKNQRTCYDCVLCEYPSG